MNSAALEIPAECTLKVDVLKGKAISWPRIETPNSIITVGLSKPLDEALKLATGEMVQWLVEDYGFDRWDASILLCLVSKGRACAVANFNYVMAVEFPKKYLRK